MKLYKMFTSLKIGITRKARSKDSPKRKAVSSAFYQNMLESMARTIKEVTMTEVIRQQKKGVEVELDIAEMTKELQSRIIINVAVGKGNSKKR